MDQSLEAAALFGGSSEHLLDEFTVSELGFCTGGVGEQFLQEVPSDLVGVCQED
jgi:hypothetical protein